VTRLDLRALEREIRILDQTVGIGVVGRIDRDAHRDIEMNLAVGDRVVSAGHNKLRNGQAVKIDNSIALPAVTGP
jgi:hypothetical protein